jgi:hypothetical protein
MSRIAETFAYLRAAGRTALMPYLMTGYPEHDSALELAPALESGWRRSVRTRRSILRSARRRRHDPARLGARPRQRHSPGTLHRNGCRVAQTWRARADRADGVLQPIFAVRS